MMQTIQKQCRKIIPPWLLVLDNLPTLSLYALGTVILWQFAFWSGIVFLLYSISTFGWFWYRICTSCPHFGTYGCPCGYGFISSILFKKKEGREFKKVFNGNLFYLFPAWFVPPVIAAYLFITNCNPSLLIISVIFCIDGFLVIPLVSKRIVCQNCSIKDSCPWMKK
jgi:hypothetical protein